MQASSRSPPFKQQQVTHATPSLVSPAFFTKVCKLSSSYDDWLGLSWQGKCRKRSWTSKPASLAWHADCQNMMAENVLLLWLISQTYWRLLNYATLQHWWNVSTLAGHFCYWRPAAVQEMQDHQVQVELFWVVVNYTILQVTWTRGPGALTLLLKLKTRNIKMLWKVSDRTYVILCTCTRC